MLSGCCGLSPRQGPQTAGCRGYWNYNSRRAPREGTGRLPWTALAVKSQESEDPGSWQRREVGVRVRAGPAPSCSVPIIVNRRRLGGVGMGLPRAARGEAQEAAVVAAA